MDPWCQCLQGKKRRREGRDLEISLLNGCHFILVQDKASGKGRYLACSSICSPTDLSLSWSKSALAWMLIAQSDSRSVCIKDQPVDGTCAIYLVCRSYLFASSFEEITVIFSLEEKTPLGIDKKLLFFQGYLKIKKKIDHKSS